MSRKHTSIPRPKISSISGTASQGFEPFEPTNPIPWPLLALMLALVAWGVLALVNNHLSQDDSHEIAQVHVTPSPTAPAPSQTQQGADLFLAHCSTCHQNNGAGIANAVPPLTKSPYVAAPEALISIMLLGITGEIEIGGKIYNGRMPTFGKNLNDEQMAAIANYIRQSWGNDASVITPAQVGEQRQKFSLRNTPWAGSQELATTFNLFSAADLSSSPAKGDEQ